MKNMQISKKLLLSFFIAILLPSLAAIAGLTGMRLISNASTRMYTEYTNPLTHLSYSIENLQEMRYLLHEYIVVTALDYNPGRVDEIGDRIEDLIASFNQNLDIFAPAMVMPEAISLYTEARGIVNNEYVPYLRRAHGYALAHDPVSIYNELGTMAGLIHRALSNLNRVFEIRVNLAYEAASDNFTLNRVLRFANIAMLIVACVVSVSFALYISSSVGKPMKLLSVFTTLMGRDGDIVYRPESRATVDYYSERKDEIGDIFRALDGLVEYMNECSGELQRVAEGDLTVDVIIRSERDAFSKQLKSMVEDLHEMFSEIDEASEQVSTGASQIADGAQTLAQGATEQAATLEQLSASTAEISAKTKANAQMAERGSALAKNIKESAEKGSRQMDEMVEAVGEIYDASQSISKVIKVIDDIAFQTNILALNAAVEAARAGQHGKGFAVVADEVRTLAAKSAEAAKDTGVLISSSMEKAEHGARIAKETAESLVDIVNGINQSSEIVHVIAEASEEQTRGFTQIDTGIDHIATVVQHNSAVAEQSAAASHELNDQSDTLRAMINRFKLNKSANPRSKGLLPAREAQ